MSDAGPDSATTPVQAALAASGDARARGRILIVDDDARNAFAATNALADLDCEIVVARSGEEALRRLLDEDFAVILLDLHMPGMDGYETAAFIRQRRRSRDIPIVFVTAVFRDEAHLFQAYSAGAVDVVFKPVDPFILRSKVKVLVDLHLRTLELQSQSEHRRRLLEENARVQREKAQAELALKRSQERQQAILESLTIVFHSRSIAPPYQPLFLSNNVEALTGFPAQAFLDQPDFGSSRIHPQDLPDVVKAVAGAVERGFYACEFRWLNARGEYRRFLDQGLLARSDNGEDEIWGALLDVTERRQMEEQLTQIQKMEAVGQLTGGVAHDFNNLLTVIVGSLDLLERHGAHQEKRERHLGAVRHAAERGQSLTRQLLAFSRRQRLSPVTLDVSALIDAFAPLIRQAVGDAVTVQLDLGETGLNVDVDAAQLETALLNLAVNARDAMPKGGQLTIRAALSRGPSADGRAVDSKAGDWVRIEMIDTGHGIPPETLEKVFEPFYTTKDVGKGSGLGLSQVYGFVQQSGGHITADNMPDAGACFRLYLPQSETAPVQEEEAPPAVATEGHGRLLVVEDDRQVLAVTTEMLSGLGYEVTTACDAASALEVLKTGEPVDLLFSDVIMPGGRNGLELAEIARELRPDLKVLLSSGYVGQGVSLTESAFEVIDKPYERSALAAKLSELLSEDPGVSDQGKPRRAPRRRRSAAAEAKPAAPSSAH